MQIVIDISEEDYKRGTVLASAIRNDIPLPKEHGKIVDIDKLIDSKCNECRHIRGVSCTIPCYAVRRMLNADTIIEADKESEDKYERYGKNRVSN